MDPLLKLLHEDARRSAAELAALLNEPVEQVKARIADYEKQGVIRGYQALINTDLVDDDAVRAIIELRIRPAQDCGFDKIAQRIARFAQVESMHLVSGGFDLLLFVKGRNLQEVAQFVSSKLANMEGVLSTSTHFMLKTYKDQGVLMETFAHDDRLQVAP